MQWKAIFIFILINEASLHDHGNFHVDDILCDNGNVHGNLDDSLRTWLREKCGQRPQVNQSPFRSIRSVGGEEVAKGIYPWTVAIESEEEYCTGALISPRHVLTAGHCVMSTSNAHMCSIKHLFNEEEKKRYFGCKPLRTDQIYVYIGASHNPPHESERGLYVVPVVANLTIHPKCSQCTFDHDLALLELTPNTLRHGSPICMPVENETIPDNVSFAGYGLNPKHPDDQLHEPLETVNITVNRTATIDSQEKKLIVTGPPGGSICSGDSGGPLFKWNGTRYILIGIASSGFGCQDDVGEDAGTSFFEDITKHINWVCVHSGVCPMKRTSAP